MYNRYALEAWGARISGITGPTRLLDREGRQSDVLGRTDRKRSTEVRHKKSRPYKGRKRTQGFKGGRAHLATPILELVNKLHVLVVLEFCAK